MNSEYIKAMDFEKFCEMALPWLEKEECLKQYDSRKLLKLIQSRTEILSEIPEKLKFLPSVAEHSTEMYCHKKFKLDVEGAKESLIQVLAKYESLTEWNETTIHDALIELAQETGKKNGMIMWPARVALCGLDSTPGGAVELADIIGKEETIKRLKNAIEMFK
jgi:glutamyl-tRNA synthetase